ncbi:MAG: DNA cytosine methyltransferase [Pedobacter sp.]|nr:DNA cytosine methyltransferase [Pedobacter sp.]
MRAISLFSGCGGIDFAARELGIDVVFANDIIPETKDTFKAYFPEVDFHLEDIRLISKFPKVDLVTGGYPCQSFSMGGKRDPKSDPRTFLFHEFARTVSTVSPKFFVAENVSGLTSVQDGRWLDLQLKTFQNAGLYGYNIASVVLNARDYGVPQRRKRVFIVGIRKDLNLYYHFPTPTHCKPELAASKGLKPWESHGEAIRHLIFDVPGEFYQRLHDPDGGFSWYYMSRNRKANWLDASFTIVANFRHTTLHPASPVMKMEWSNLADGYKQKWNFSNEYEHILFDPSLPVLEKPRRLSWREAAAIQTFPKGFEPAGSLEKKFTQIGNAVPPELMKAVLSEIVTGNGLKDYPSKDEQSVIFGHQLSLDGIDSATDNEVEESLIG